MFMKKNLLMTFLLTMLSIATIFAQDKKVSGKVTSAEDGSGLPGVTVQIKGTGKGTQSDVNGNYSLSVPSSATLVFSFVGLNPKTAGAKNTKGFRALTPREYGLMKPLCQVIP